MRFIGIRMVALVAVGILLAATPAVAQDDSAGSKNWRYELAPYYLWAAALDGEATLKGQTADVDVSFSDILDDLDFMFSAHFEAHHKNGWGYVIEPLFIDLESKGQTPGGTLVVETELKFIEGMVINQLADPGRSFELIWGVRYYSFDFEFDFPVALDVGEDESWFDAVVGTRWMTELGEKWILSLRADIASGGSDFTWQASGLAIWKMSKKTSLVFGYRHLDIDYEDGDGADRFALDAAMSGPIAGLNISW